MLKFLYVLFGVIDSSSIFKATFGSWMVPFIIMTSCLNIMLSESGFLSRIVKWFISRKAVQGRPWMFFFLYTLAVFIVSMFSSLVAYTIVMLPIVTQICEELCLDRNSKFAKMMFLSTMWVILIGYIATPIGHEVPVLILGLFEVTFGIKASLTKYMVVCMPVAFMMLLLVNIYFRFVVRPDVSDYEKYNVSEKQSEIKPMDKREKTVVAIFFLVVFLLIGPELLKSVSPKLYELSARVGLVSPVIFGVCLSCILKIEDKPLMVFSDVLSKVMWPQVFLAAGTYALVAVMGLESTGITLWLTNIMDPLFVGTTSWLPFILVVACLCAVLTQFMSCTVVANMVFIVSVPIAVSLFRVVNPYAVGILIAFMPSIGVMTPPASTPASIYLSCGWLSPADGLKHGFVMMLIDIVLSVFVLYPLCCIVFPYTA